MPLPLPDFDRSEEQREFRDVVRRFLETHAPMTEVRRVMESDCGLAPELWRKLCEELGLAGLAIREEDGGQGFGLAELAIAIGEVGRSLAPLPLFASAGLAARVIEAVTVDAERAEWLGPIASGSVATLAWIEASGRQALEAVASEVLEKGGGARIRGEKHFVLDAGGADRFFVVAREPGSRKSEGLGLFCVEADAAGVRIEAVESLDPTRRLSVVRFEEASARRVGSRTSCHAELARGLEEATALLCAEMVGGMEKVLETAVAYAGSRHQFGRPIGSFQAIKHKCADMLIDFECARTASHAALASIDAGDPDRTLLTSVAKAHVGPAFVRMATENIQIHGGVGYTWEYDAHLFFRRAQSSSILLGDTVEQHERLAAALDSSLMSAPEGGAGRSRAGDGARAGEGRDERAGEGGRLKRDDTAEEAAFRAEARAWLEANAKRRTGDGDWSRGPVDHSFEAEQEYWSRMKAWQRTKFDGGWAAITWAPEHGGRGGTPAQALIFNEEQAAFDVTSGYIDAAVGLIGPSLIRFGTDEQRARYLKPMLRGDEIWCQLFSEPEAGSDLAAVRTRGTIEGDELVLNGQKVWTTSAQHADFGFILARTNPDVPKHQGISFAMVDMRQPGVEVRPLVTMKGDRHFNEVFFNEVRTPLSNVVNGIDAGWPVATFVLMNEGASIGTTNLGRTQTVDIARAAIESGRFEDPIVRQRIAATFVEERILELLQQRLKAAILDGRRPDIDGSVLKILWSEGGHRKAETAIWVQGAHALRAGRRAPASGLWQDHLLARAAGTVGGGTSEVHRNGLGERALGLPREPRLDRDVPFKDLKISG